MSDWITWKGGYAPVDRNTAVFVRHRDGWESRVPVLPSRIAWQHQGHLDDIIAYRIIAS